MSRWFCGVERSSSDSGQEHGNVKWQRLSPKRRCDRIHDLSQCVKPTVGDIKDRTRDARFDGRCKQPSSAFDVDALVFVDRLLDAVKARCEMNDDIDVPRR